MTDPGTEAESVGVLDAIFRWLRTVGSFNASHPLAVRAAEALVAAVAAARPPFHVQFVLGAAFRDRTLVMITPETLERTTFIASVLARAGIHELGFDAVPTVAAVREVGELLAPALLGGAVDLEGVTVPGLRWRAIADARRGVAAEVVDPEVAAMAGVALAIADADGLPATGAWPWTRGVMLIRRIEQAASVQMYSTLRAVELAPTAWSPARAAVSAAIHVLCACRALGMSTAASRPAGHAAVIAVLRGAAGPGPLAAEAGAIAAGVFAAAGPLDPHQLRVGAVLLDLDLPRHERNVALTSLVELAVWMERARRPERADFVLSRADLLAHAIGHRDCDPRWLRVLINVCGVVPPGARVLLADGRHATVLGPGASRDPWRPEVLVDGLILTPPQPVRLAPFLRGTA